MKSGAYVIHRKSTHGVIAVRLEILKTVATVDKCNHFFLKDESFIQIFSDIFVKQHYLSLIITAHTIDDQLQFS